MLFIPPRHPPHVVGHEFLFDFRETFSLVKRNSCRAFLLPFCNQRAGEGEKGEQLS